jgi:hypothetical protein
MKTKAWIFFLVFSLILGACAPTGTPFAGPDISDKVTAKTVTIVSASASPASVAYAFDCGTTSVPTVNITFTVSFDDPLARPLTTMDVQIHFEHVYGVTYVGDFILEILGRTGTVDTYSGDLESNVPGFGSKLAAIYAGKPGVFSWTATVVDESLTVLAKTGVLEVPFAACAAPPMLFPLSTVMPPRVNITIVPPGPIVKPNPGGGGSPPYCSVDPNNPNCVPGP